MEIECNFEFYKNEDGKHIYQCLIENKIIPNCEFNIVGDHVEGKDNSHVQEVRFEYSCVIDHIPKGLTKVFPNIEDLSILKSSIKYINKNDLAEYQFLKILYIHESEIKFLSGNLFEDFHNLEEVSFEGKIAKIVEPNILDGQNNLLTASFCDDYNYIKCFSIINREESNATLEEVKEELNQVYNTYKNIMNEHMKAVDPIKDISYYIKSHIKDERFKDFKILIGEREFHVHKFVLAARSPTFADIFLNSPEVENLKLVDIPEEIFEMILKFMYADELPNIEELDLLRLFSAAGRLQIEELKEFAASHYLDKINSQNALDVLKISNKYEHAELKNKAFEKLQLDYPKIPFKDNWANKAGFVEKVIEKFKEKEAAVKMLEDKFANDLMDSD